jgi:hypothetical protein
MAIHKAMRKKAANAVSHPFSDWRISPMCRLALAVAPLVGIQVTPVPAQGGSNAHGDGGTDATMHPGETRLLTGAIEEIADHAERILKSVAETAYTNPQEWDNRIDCLIKLPDGSVVGEMISLHEATEERIRDAGIRLQPYERHPPRPNHDPRPVLRLGRSPGGAIRVRWVRSGGDDREQPQS